MRNGRLLTFCAGVTIAMCCRPGWTQSPAGTYPTRPVTMVVPFAPGGPADIEARLYTNGLMTGLGQPILIDYKPGAGASIGTSHVARAAPDGYTIIWLGPSFTVYPAFFPADKLPYDPVRDFAPISLTTKRSTILLVHPSLNVKTFPEYVAYARANPEKMNFGTNGGGGIQHIVGAWLHGEINAKATFIHYKGVAPLYADLLAGRVTAAMAVMSAGLPYVKAGKLVALVTMSSERSKYLPDLRTVSESALPGFDYTSWSGYSAPARTPDAIVNRLSAEFARIVKAPDLIKRMDAEGTDMVGSTPEQFRQIITTETTRWRKVVQENAIKLEQ